MPRVEWYSKLNGGTTREGIVCGYVAQAHRTYAIVIENGLFYEIPIGDLIHTGWTE